MAMTGLVHSARFRNALLLAELLGVVGATTGMAGEPSTVDCRADVACFAARARTCAPARLSLEDRARGLGWASGGVTLAVVKRRSGGDCLVDIDVSHDARAPSDVDLSDELLDLNRHNRCGLDPSLTARLAERLAQKDEIRREDLRTCRLRNPECGGPDPRLASACSITACDDGMRDVVCASDGGVARCPYTWVNQWPPGAAYCAAGGALQILYRVPDAGCPECGESYRPAERRRPVWIHPRSR